MFFFVPAFTNEQTAVIWGHEQVADAYIPRGQLMVRFWGVARNPTSEGGPPAGDDDWFMDTLNSTESELQERSILAKRSEIVESNSPDVMVSLSWPPDIGPVPVQGDYRYAVLLFVFPPAVFLSSRVIVRVYVSVCVTVTNTDCNRFDSSAGEGTYVYNVDFGAQPSHPEFSGVLFHHPLLPGPYPVSGWMENDPKRHGTMCLSKAVGTTIGIARKATVVATAWDFQKSINEHWLDALAKVHADISTGARGAKSVVNLSISIPQADLTAAFLKKMGKSLFVHPQVGRRALWLTILASCLALLIREIIKLGAVFVTGTGNDEGSPNGYPALFGDPANPNHIPELIVVGSVLGQGILGFHADADWVTCYAPGYGLRLANSNPSSATGYRTTQGTSFASATVAGLAAYFRGLDSTLTTAVSVKERIVRLAYRRQPQPNHPEGPYQRYIDRVVWNGQKWGRSIVPECSGGSKAKRQSSGGSCPVAFPPQPSPLTFRTGPPQPTCAGAGCGSSCAGFFCPGTPLKQNPDFLDPRNPDSVQNPDSPYYEDWDGTITRTTTTTTKTIPTTTPTPPKPSSVPIGGACLLTDECEDNCPQPGSAYCKLRVCTCWAPPPKTTPPHAAMCYNVPMCLEAYDCGPGAFMVCEPTDYSNGNGLCQCIKGNPS
jgi:hypothetical protein